MLSQLTDDARAKLAYELKALEHIAQVGNPLSSVLLFKFELDDSDSPNFLSGEDGRALRSALTTLGFDPEDFCAFGPCADAEFLEILATIDPLTVILCDDLSAAAFERSMATLCTDSEVDPMNLQAGALNLIFGMQVLNLGGFSKSLADAHQKQRVWTYLKQLESNYLPY